MGLMEENKVVVRFGSGWCTRRRLAAAAALLLVVLVLAAAIAAAISLPLTLSSSPSSNAPKGNVVTLDDLFNSSFQSKFFEATWTKGNELLYVSGDEGVVLYNPAGNTTTLMEPNLLTEFNVTSVKLAPSGDYLLLISYWQKVFRHSFLAYYYLFDVSTKDITSVANGNLLQYAAWSPTSKAIAYVMGNNVFIYDVQNNNSSAVTTDGQVNLHYNGVPDWVYEEEVLSTNYALWWSPDGGQILYLSINDTPVKDFMFPLYGPAADQYTHIDSIAYPKAGTSNPTVKVWVADAQEPSSKSHLLPPNEFISDYYVVFGGWANSSSASVVWSNRAQNTSIYCFYNQITDQDQISCDKVYEQRSEAWNEILQPPMFTESGQNMLILAPCETGDDHFTHIVSVMTNSVGVQCLTSGEWEVTQIVAVDDCGMDVLYISTETHPWQRHVYSSKTKSCLTCSQDTWDIPKSGNPSIGDHCDYFSASCSSDLRYCLLQCSGPSLPFSLLVAYKGNTFEPVKLLEQNTDLQCVVESIDLPTVDMLEVPASNDGPKLYGRIMYPPYFRVEKKYPVLVYVYGGPYSQMIGNTSVISRLSTVFLSSKLDMIVVSVDGRGTGFRGDRFKHAVYRRLGLDETTDQLRAARYLQQLEFVEESNLAIYGASYGGYMAGMVGGSGSGVFRAAISQSPVTDWLYYDSIYTERYMGQPTADDNLNGYMASSLLHRAANLSMVDYLLIHGTGDDNVHFQNTAQLVRVLTESEIEFRLQVYTDKAHALSGTHTRRHLYQLIVDFLRNSFQSN